MVTRLSVLFLLLLANIPLHATERFYEPLDSYITKSDVIAIVTVTTTREQDAKNAGRIGKTHYRYATPVTTLETLKGEAPKSFMVYHFSALDDCLFQQGPGNYLVFLKRADKEAFTGIGWYPSVKFIDARGVMGWNDDHAGTHFETLEVVKKQIAAKSGKAKE